MTEFLSLYNGFLLSETPLVIFKPKAYAESLILEPNNRSAARESLSIAVEIDGNDSPLNMLTVALVRRFHRLLPNSMITLRVVPY